MSPFWQLAQLTAVTVGRNTCCYCWQWHLAAFTVCSDTCCHCLAVTPVAASLSLLLDLPTAKLAVLIQLHVQQWIYVTLITSMIILVLQSHFSFQEAFNMNSCLGFTITEQQTTHSLWTHNTHQIDVCPGQWRFRLQDSSKTCMFDLLEKRQLPSEPSKVLMWFPCQPLEKQPTKHCGWQWNVVGLQLANSTNGKWAYN